MLPSKPRSGLSENNKTVPTTPNVGKIGRTGSTKSSSGAPAPAQKSRASPKTVESKSPVERRTPKISSSAPEKQSRAPKGSELQAQLGGVQEDLKKAKEQLASVEQEKARVIEELNDAKKLADEANEKLKEALVTQKRAEENLEIEKFRAVELEQTSTEASKKKDEEWGKELDSIKKKHDLDVEALLSATRELEKVRDELQMTIKDKISALSQAEDAMKVAETNAEKVEFLSCEVSRLKSRLDSKLDGTNCDAANIIKKLDFEVDSLRNELERAKQAEEKLVIMESLIERLSNEADDAKSAELDSLKLVDEWKKRAESLEIQLMEARESKKSSIESLASVKKQLEESNASLQDSEFQTAALRQKIELLEDQLDEASRAEKSSSESQASLEKQLEEVNASLQDAESEAAVLRGKVESLEIEVADVKKAGLYSSELADEWKKKAEMLEVQLAEANQFNESSSDSFASVTKQLEDSNSSLHDVLSENAGLQVKIESLEIELARCKEELTDSEKRLDAARQEATEMGKEIEDLRSQIQVLEEARSRALNGEKVAACDAESFSEEKNKLLKELEVARQEEENAKKAMEGLASALHEMSAEARETQERLFTKRLEHENAHAQIEQLRLAVRNTEENYEVMLDEARYEIVCLKRALERLETEAKESQVKRDSEGSTDLEMVENENILDNGEEMASRLRQAESGATCANEAAEEAKAEALMLKERLLDKQKELQSISQENAELRTQEADSIKKLNELSALLVEAKAKNPEENGDSSNSEKEYDLLPSSKEIPVGSVNGSIEEKPTSGEDMKPKEENGNGHHYLGEEEPVEVEDKMLEGYKSADKSKELSSEMENEEEAIDSDLDMKIGGGSFDHTNGSALETIEDGSVSPTKQQQLQQKKKKHLFPKFSLLKKKSPHK